MCYYRLYVFLGCGHSTTSPEPLRRCADARARRTETQSPDRSPRPTETIREDQSTAVRPQSGVSTFSVATTAVECGSRMSPEPVPSSHHIPRGIDRDRDQARGPSQQHDAGKVERPSGKQTCENQSFHPYQSYKIHTLCPRCTRIRSQRLSSLESGNEVRFDDWKWKVKYISPVPESRYVDSDWAKGIGEWTENMGSWVKDMKGKGIELGIGLQEILNEGSSDSRRDRSDEREGELGFSGGMPSS